MKKAIFGPAGNSDSFKARYKSFKDIAKYVSEMGLDAFEYQFGRGVRMSEKNASIIKDECIKYNVKISAHAPYYISLASDEEEKRNNSLRYILETAKAVKNMGGNRIVVHSGSVGKKSREEAFMLAKETLAKSISYLDSSGYGDVVICPETMGKINQLGSLCEVLDFCKLDERIIPCIDFGHLNARTHGSIKSKEDYAKILDAVENSIGIYRTKIFHAHFSKIEYTAGGEKRHLTFEDREYGPDPQMLMELISERNLTPVIICESNGTQAEDALAMKYMYENYNNVREDN
jgi:deoxyribonuclease-4